MGVKKGFVVWDDTKIKAAQLINLDKTDDAIMKETGCSKTLVTNVRAALKKGQELPGGSVTPAPVTPAPNGHKKAPSDVIKFKGIEIPCHYTPIIAMAREAAVERWNWDPNTSLEDFLDSVIYYFFKDRGIVLQGYIVEEEVKAG